MTNKALEAIANIEDDELRNFVVADLHPEDRKAFDAIWEKKLAAERGVPLTCPDCGDDISEADHCANCCRECKRSRVTVCGDCDECCGGAGCVGGQFKPLGVRLRELLDDMGTTMRDGDWANRGRAWFDDNADMVKRKLDEWGDEAQSVWGAIQSYRNMRVVEKDEGIEYRLDIPGVDPEDVSVEIVGRSILRVTCVRDGNKQRIELSVPEVYALNNCASSVKNGVLTIFVPKYRQTTPRKVTVKVL